MEKRVIIDKNSLREAIDKLKDEGLSLDDIKERTGASIRNCLYKNSSMKKSAFNKLTELAETEIEHETKYYIDGSGFVDGEPVPRSEKLAELIGIILGDGHLHERKQVENEGNQYYISVTLHKDEERMKEHTKELMSDLLSEKPKEYSNNHFKSTQLRVWSKADVIKLKEHGLISGNKVEEQVGVPNWIKQDKNYATACLRGLIDTDGTIYQRSHDDYYVAQFKNRSHPLLDDFRDMCEKIGVKCSKAGKYQIQIASQGELKKFIKKVDPIKAERQGPDLKGTLLKSSY